MKRNIGKSKTMRAAAIGLAALIAVTSAPVEVFADELVLGEEEDIDLSLLEEDPADITGDTPDLSKEDIPDLSGADTSDLSEDEMFSFTEDTQEFDLAADGASVGEITAIDTPEKTKYSFDLKRGYDWVNEKLPGTLTVHIGNKTKKINVRWICEGDYNDVLGEYPFIPDLEGYKLAKDVELPKLILTFDKETFGNSGAKKAATLRIPRKNIPFVEADLGLSGVALPAKFDSFANKKLPVVRDQGETGTCWAHSSIGAIEADLCHDGITTDVDLSEMHLAYHVYNEYEDPKGCRKDKVTLIGEDDYLQFGGDTEMAANVLSNMVGATLEDDFPLSADPDAFDADPAYVTGMDVAQIRNAYFINVKDSKGIKSAIKAHGGVTAGIKFEPDDYGCVANNAYYCPKPGIDHAVMLVGWDDNFSKNKFNSQKGGKPKNNGAWLVRNSYGDNNYSLDGYFWMSYEDVSFVRNDYGICVAYDAVVDTKLYDNCYAYDGSPYPSDDVKIKPDDTVYVTYDVSGNEAVKGVGIELSSQNATVYVTAMNSATGQYVSGSKHTSNVGIYTVEFSKPLQVYGKSEVILYVNIISDNGKNAILSAETPGENEAMDDVICTANVDRGFYLNNKKIKKDPRIKLYTVNSKKSPVKVTGVTLNKKNASVVKGKTMTLKATIRPQNASTILVTWSSDKKSVATVNEAGVVKGKKAGKAKITVTTKDGKKKASCTVTVKNPVKVKGVTLNKKSAQVKVGKSITLKATVSPKKATDKTVTWKSKNPKIATVNKNGKVTGKKKGKTTITVTTKDGKKKASCEITVKK